MKKNLLLILSLCIVSIFYLSSAQKSQALISGGGAPPDCAVDSDCSSFQYCNAGFCTTVDTTTCNVHHCDTVNPSHYVFSCPAAGGNQQDLQQNPGLVDYYNHICSWNNCAVSQAGFTPPCYAAGTCDIQNSVVYSCAAGFCGAQCDANNGSSCDLTTCQFTNGGTTGNPPNSFGFLDNVACTTNGVSGWACDAANTGLHLQIDFYRDQPWFNGGTYVGSAFTGVSRPDVTATCNGNATAGFNFTIPAQYQDGAFHNYYAYINEPNSGNPALGTQPKGATCYAACATAMTAPAVQGAVCTGPNTSSNTVTWTAKTGATQYVLDWWYTQAGVYNECQKAVNGTTTTISPADTSTATHIAGTQCYPTGNAVISMGTAVKVNAPCNYGPYSTTTGFQSKDCTFYNISGRVYNDVDAGKCYNPSTSGCTDASITPNVVHNAGVDTTYTSSSTSIKITGTGVNQTLTQANGIFNTGQVLPSGTYTVTLTTVPTDYHMTYPKNGVPAFFTINVGKATTSTPCSTNNANDASCDGSGNIANLNFGINNENAHGAGICTDVRDEIDTQQFIPDTASCGVLTGKYYIYGNNSCPTGAGVYASGSVSPDFGHGLPNPDNWLVGGATSEVFSPVNPGVIRTASSYLDTTLTQNAITPTDLNTVCTPSNCYLPDDLPSGVYSYPFDTTFVGTHATGGGNVDGTYTFPAGKNYVFITGDGTHQSNMTFKTKMLVPNGSTATFVSSKDIIVDPSIGESTITSTKGDLEGFYSADESFIIDSAYTVDNRCTDSGGTKDLRFNLIGSVVVDAAKQGGSLVNNRDLCAGDLTCPVYTTGLGDGGDNGGGLSGDTTGTQLGITYLLNAPDIIKHKNTFWQELAP